MPLEDFFSISKRNGSKLFISTVGHLYFLMLTCLVFIIYKIPFLLIKLELVIKFIALRLRLYLLIYQK